MIVKVDVMEYGVKFKHEPSMLCDTRDTFCLIYCDGVVIESGVSRCYYTDNFSRSIGRKKALTRALRNFPRTQRKLFWDEYWLHHKK